MECLLELAHLTPILYILILPQPTLNQSKLSETNLSKTMANNQQTAVEWLWDKLLEETETGELRYHLKHDVVKVFEEAIQMEREQIVSAYSHGWHDGQDEIINRIAHIDKGGDEAGLNHFNDTYGTEPSR